MHAAAEPPTDEAGPLGPPRFLGGRHSTTPLSLLAAATSLLLTTACATRPTAGGGRETVLLGGAVTVATKSFQPAAQTTIPVDTTKLLGRGRPSGARTTVLWGLLTFQDY